MKSRIGKLICFMLCMSPATKAQQTDPALLAAVEAQTKTLSDENKEQTKKLTSIQTSQLVIETSMTKLHDIENKVFNYLCNASSAVNNLRDIKRSGELLLVEIPANMKRVEEASSHNVKNTILTAMVAEELKDSKEQMISVYSLLDNLVKSGSYQSGHGDDKNLTKVNLLNAAERDEICSSIVNSLEMINTNLYILSFRIQYMNWSQFFLEYDPESWGYIMSGDNIANGIIQSWKDLAEE